MGFRTRLMLYLNGLLLITVALIGGLTLFSTVHSLRERARRDTLGTATMLASVVELLAGPSGEAESPVGAPGAAQVKSAAHRLVQSVVGVGNLEAVIVVSPDGQIESPTDDEQKRDYYTSGLDLMAAETSRTLKPDSRFRGGWLEVCVPLAGFGNRAGALICRMSTRRLDEAVAASLRDVVVLSIAGLFAGALISSVLAKRVSEPVRALANAARIVGSGGFTHRVRVDAADEVGMLAESFNQMAESLEAYTKELAQTTAEREALRREMDIAAEIQRSLLPASCPTIDGFDVAGDTLPAREVGGDFYDFIPLPEGRWGVVIADVSGKGVPAALLMALSRSLIRAYSRSHPSVLNALELANDFMLKDTRSGMFVTCFYAVVDPRRRTLVYVNAGHNPPVVARPTEPVVLLRASGTPLGVIEQPGIVEEQCDLAAGDTVLMYTDGITEAAAPNGERFGVHRLEEVVRNSLHVPAAQVCRRVISAAEAFAEGQPQFDDMTAIVLRVL